MNIILINGTKRSGKDYTATIISEELAKKGFTTKIMSFASPIKSMMATLFNISIDQLEILKNEETELYTISNSNTKKITDFRSILQRFGTEVCKPQFGETIWADLLISEISKVSSNTDVILVTDFRFEIESITLKSSKHNITTLHIKNDSISRIDNHSSERELDLYSFDYEIDNTNYDAQIKTKVEYFVRYYLSNTKGVL